MVVYAWLDYAAGAVITGTPVAGKCRSNRYAGAGTCMDKLAVAEINAAVRRAGFISAEENQIARAQLRHKPHG